MSRDSLETIQPIIEKPLVKTSIQNGRFLNRESIISTPFSDQTHDTAKPAILESVINQEAQVNSPSHPTKAVQSRQESNIADPEQEAKTATSPHVAKMADPPLAEVLGDQATAVHTPEISSDSSRLQQILDVQQKTIDRLLESVKTLQAEIVTVTSHSTGLQQALTEQQKNVDRVLSSLEILYTGMDKMNGVLTKTQESSEGDPQPQDIWTAQPATQDPSTKMKYLFQQVSEKLSQFGNKANEVEGLKLALKAMRNRVETLERSQNSAVVQAPQKTSNDYSRPVQTARRTGPSPGHLFPQKNKVQPKLILKETLGHDMNGDDATSEYILTVAPQQSPVLNDSVNADPTMPRLSQMKTVETTSSAKRNGEDINHVQTTALENLGPGEGAAVEVSSSSQQGWQALNPSKATSTLEESNLGPSASTQSDMPPPDLPLTFHGLEDSRDTDYNPSQDAVDSDTQEVDMMDMEVPDSLIDSLVMTNKNGLATQRQDPASELPRKTMKPTRGISSMRGGGMRGRGRGRPRRASPRFATPPWEKLDWNGPEDLADATKAVTHKTPTSSRGRNIMRRGLSSGISAGSITPHQDYAPQQDARLSEGRKRDSEGYLLRWNGERDKRSLRGRGRGKGGQDGGSAHRSHSHERLMNLIFPDRRKAAEDEAPFIKLEDESSE